MTTLYPQTLDINNIETVGFNARQGHFAVLDNGERVTLDRKDYYKILAAARRQEELAARADDYLLAQSEELIADFAEYHRNRGEWCG